MHFRLFKANSANFFRSTQIIFSLVGTSLITSGCVTTVDSITDVGQFRSVQDKFDGAKRISLTPAWVAKNDSKGVSWATPYKLGAQWVSTNPGEVQMIIEVPNQIVGIRGLGLNIEGSVINFDAITSTNFKLETSFSVKSSVGYVSVPIDIFKLAVSSSDVNVRVSFTGGKFSDGDFDQPAGWGNAPTAKKYLKDKFIPELNNTRSN